MAKFGMSMCTLGMAEEFKRQGIAVNSLWPRTAIATAAVRNRPGRRRHGGRVPHARHPGRRRLRDPHRGRSRECSGNFFIDEEVLRAEGVTDFSRYAPGSIDQAQPLQGDFFVPDAVFDRSPTKIKRGF